MKIYLESNPSDAPCCIKIVAEDGREDLVQTDWDWPAVASSFGWSTREVQKHGQCGHVSTGLHNQLVKYCKHCEENTQEYVCHHSGTDGTIDCPECGVKAGEFIQAAREWIDDNDGAEADDPGYFEAQRV